MGLDSYLLQGLPLTFCRLLALFANNLFEPNDSDAVEKVRLSQQDLGQSI